MNIFPEIPLEIEKCSMYTVMYNGVSVNFFANRMEEKTHHGYGYIHFYLDDKETAAFKLSADTEFGYCVRDEWHYREE